MQVQKLKIIVGTSGRYARALFDLAVANNNLNKIYVDIAAINKLLAQEELLKKLFQNNFLSVKNSTELLSEIVKLNEFDQLILDFLILLVKKRRANLIFDIFKSFQSLIDEQQNVLSIQIEVFKKHPAFLNALQKTLKAKFQSSAYNFNTIENPSLLSGFKIFVKGMCLDYSLKGRLDRIRYKLKEIK